MTENQYTNAKLNNHQALVDACKDGLRAMRALGCDKLVVGDIGAANRIAWTNAMMALKAATEDKLIEAWEALDDHRPRSAARRAYDAGETISPE